MGGCEWLIGLACVPIGSAVRYEKKCFARRDNLVDYIAQYRWDLRSSGSSRIGFVLVLPLAVCHI